MITLNCNNSISYVIFYVYVLFSVIKFSLNLDYIYIFILGIMHVITGAAGIAIYKISNQEYPRRVKPNESY